MHLKSALLSIVLTLGISAPGTFAQEKKGVAFRALPVLQTDDKLHFLLPMTVEGVDSNFLLDTGCGYSVVASLELAKALKKDLGKGSEMEGVGGTSKAYEVAFGQFKLGRSYAVQFQKTHVTSMKEFSDFLVKGKPIKVQGLIGSKTLMALRGVFDTASGRIIIPPKGAANDLYKNSKAAGGALVLPLAKKAFSRPYIEVEIKGKSYQFLIDTGASTCLLEPELVKALGLTPTETTGTVVGKGDGVVKGAARVKVKDVMLAGKVKIPELGFTVLKTQGLDEEGISYGGIIGVPVLNALKAQLDFGSYSLIIPR